MGMFNKLSEKMKELKESLKIEIETKEVFKENDHKHNGYVVWAFIVLISVLLIALFYKYNSKPEQPIVFPSADIKVKVGELMIPPAETKEETIQSEEDARKKLKEIEARERDKILLFIDIKANRRATELEMNNSIKEKQNLKERLIKLGFENSSVIQSIDRSLIFSNQLKDIVKNYGSMEDLRKAVN